LIHVDPKPKATAVADHAAHLFKEKQCLEILVFPTRTRSIATIEHEYHFIEYEYDLGTSMVAISEKSREITN